MTLLQYLSPSKERGKVVFEGALPLQPSIHKRELAIIGSWDNILVNVNKNGRQGMKRYLIPILIILMLVSGLTVGCSQSQESGATVTGDKASWTEKQVIEHLYEYLMNKAGQLQDAHTQAKKIIVDWGFYDAITEANREALDEDFPDIGEYIEMQFEEPLGITQQPSRIAIWTSALRRLAQYDGDGWWSVFIGDQEWQVNERTREVVAQNEEAAKLLEEISHDTYHSSMYGYHIDYPAVWIVTEVGIEGNVLIVAPEPQVDILVDKPRKLEPGQSLGEYASGFAAFLSTLDQDFELISLVKLESGDYQMDFEWIVGGTEIHTRTYFVLYKSLVYMISGSAPKSTYDSYLREFDYAYNSFGFN